MVIINRHRKLTCVDVPSVWGRRPDRTQRLDVYCRPSSLVGSHQSQFLGLEFKRLIHGMWMVELRIIEMSRSVKASILIFNQ